MIPSTISARTERTAFRRDVQPSLTYRIDTDNKRISKKIDGQEAIFQFVSKVLDTSKYAYTIYNWYYGNELMSLIGKPYDYVTLEIPRIVEEALLVDERIKEVKNYKFTQTNLDSIKISFDVHSIYGQIPYEMEVLIL